MEGYLERLKTYAKYIEICGENRNSYAKTDHDATFMRIKRDYMGNDQLLPAYNVQAAICDEYIAVIDAKPYASDQDCFVPLMEKYMKFTMFEKETKSEKYHTNPYRAVNFKRDTEELRNYTNAKTVKAVRTNPNAANRQKETAP